MVLVEVIVENSLNKGIITEDVAKIFGRAIRDAIQKNNLDLKNEYVGLRRDNNKLYLGIYSEKHETIKPIIALKEMFFNFMKKSDYTIKACSEVFKRRVGHNLYRMYEIGRLQKEQGKIVTLEQALQIVENEIYKDINNWQLTVDNSNYDGVDFSDRVRYRKSINRLVANQWLKVENSYDYKLGKSIVVMKLDEDRYIIGNGDKDN